MNAYNSLLTLFLLVGCAFTGAFLFPPPKHWPYTEPTDPFDTEENK
ncbi:hypothetical protein SAMN04489745_3558 [Arthrobacter woluwensis]|uniref:Uncharacterized protein n=1 Tax=Arthrobacter woluwensis TaxID=156980 RepID=A0A1H4WU80_9MICC|nr:hypothetical protein SAMN04489745_0025 [Arthrobacter woluwensis]SEC52974.1 hypothetical protein SAMN04489745_3102 [Arthrobacter woluwensis]SEC89458.1 hypothetical protein SAMN04489745_3446 [Arthrobacter woluwensis]SEC96104.1 hypothetical protein SAMN04489745_3558 [Arthrobacter woluwensis]